MADYLKEPVIQALRVAGRPLKSKELAKVLKIPSADYQAFREFLRGLEAEGEVRIRDVCCALIGMEP